MWSHSGNIVVVRSVVYDKQGRYLFGQRRDTARNNPDCWELPGGSQKWWETDRRTASREVREELGIIALIAPRSKPCAEYRRPLRENPSKHHVTRFYLARAQTTQLKVDPDEVQDAGWFYPEEIVDSVDYELTTPTRVICAFLPQLAMTNTIQLPITASDDEPGSVSDNTAA